MRQNRTFVSYNILNRMQCSHLSFRINWPVLREPQSRREEEKRILGTKITQTKVKQRNWYRLLSTDFLWTHNSLWIFFLPTKVSALCVDKIWLWLFTGTWLNQLVRCTIHVWPFSFLVHPLLDLLLNQRSVVREGMCVGQSNVAEIMWYLKQQKKMCKTKMKRFTNGFKV